MLLCGDLNPVRSASVAEPLLISGVTQGQASGNPINLGVGMTCKLCGSDRQSKFVAEIGIHFPGLKGLEKPIVWVFPELLVCLHCGNAEFAIPESELRELAKSNAAGGQQDASA